MNPTLLNLMAMTGGGGGDFVSVILWIAALGLICWLLWWLIGYIGIPEPFNKVARVIIAVLAVVVLIKIIVRVFGSPF